MIDYETLGLQELPLDDQLDTAVLAAAIQGNEEARASLEWAIDGLRNPYREVAGLVIQSLDSGDYIDFPLLWAQIDRCDSTGTLRGSSNEKVSAEQLVNRLIRSRVSDEQIRAYLEELRVRIAEKQSKEFQANAEQAVRTHESPTALANAIANLSAEYSGIGACQEGTVPSELSNLLSYADRLLSRQTGAAFEGLDTGFEVFNQLCNGLPPGLGILAAPPGMGKTTFLWQLCNQVAETEGVPVIFFSMEQSADELRAKTISRYSDLEYSNLLRGQCRLTDPDQQQALNHALQRYAGIGNHITIVEGDSTTSIERMREIVHGKLDGSSRCMIAIDYLQKVPSSKGGRGSEESHKVRIDQQVSDLRRLARDFNSPVVAISSLNRNSYRKPGLDAFKESGEIEYSADLAMVLTEVEERHDEDNPAEGFVAEYRSPGRELRLLKNRNGPLAAIRYRFEPSLARFIEDDAVRP